MKPPPDEARGKVEIWFADLVVERGEGEELGRIRVDEVGLVAEALRRRSERDSISQEVRQQVPQIHDLGEEACRREKQQERRQKRPAMDPHVLISFSHSERVTANARLAACGPGVKKLRGDRYTAVLPPSMTPPSAPRFDPGRRRAVTSALILVTALASFESTVVSTAMPTIIGDLGGLPFYSWVFSIYLLTSTVMMPIYGRLADIHGRRRILITGISVFLSGAIACAFARSMPWLIAARALQGLGAAGLVPISMTVAADLYSLEERARIQGLFSGVWGLAALVGPLAGAWMTMSFGWRSIFSINIPLGLVALTLVLTQMIESRADRPGELDLAGAATLALGVTAILFGVLHVPGPKASHLAVRLVLLAIGASALWAFVRIQKRREHPLVPPDLFRSWKTVAPYLSGVLLGTTIFGVDTFVPLFVQGARGGTPGAAGAVITPLIFFWALSATIGARLIVRFGFRASTRSGAIVVLIGLAGLFFGAWTGASVPWISAACGLVGLGLGPSSIAQILAIQHVVPERQRGRRDEPGAVLPDRRRLDRRRCAGRHPLRGPVAAAGTPGRVGRTAPLPAGCRLGRARGGLARGPGSGDRAVAASRLRDPRRPFRPERPSGLAVPGAERRRLRNEDRRRAPDRLNRYRPALKMLR